MQTTGHLARSHRAALAASLLLVAAGSARHATAQPSSDRPSIPQLTVYLSAASGNDANSGLLPNAPKRTYQAASNLLMPYRGGQPRLVILDWQGPLVPTGAATLPWAYGYDANHPAIIEYTGTQVIDTGASGFIDSACYPTAPGDHVVIRGFKLRAGSYNGLNGSPYGITLLGPWRDLRIENCDITGFFIGIAAQGHTTGNMSDLVVRNCVIADCWAPDLGPHSQGLIIGRADGVLVEGNVLDHNGWREVAPLAAPTVFRHNVYINPDNTTSVTVRGNISARASCNGFRSAGVICEDNIILQCPAGIAAGAYTRLIRGNVILDSRDVNTITPLGRGMGLGGVVDCEVVGNVVAHRTSPSTWNLGAIVVDGPARVNIHHNHIYDWSWQGDPGANAFAWTGYSSPPVSFWNNVIQMPRGGRLAWGENTNHLVTFAGNRWYGVGSALFADPVYAPGQWLNWPQRQSLIWAPGDVFVPQPPVPTVADFMQSMGRPGGLAEYLAAARAREPWVWELRPYILDHSAAGEGG